MLGERIKSARKEKGLTQLELSKMIGISRTNLKDIETGRNKGGNLEVLNNLARALDKNLSYFIEGTDVDLKIKQYQVLDNAIDMLIANNMVDEEGKIDPSCVGMMLEILQREIAIKLERQGK